MRSILVVPASRSSAPAALASEADAIAIDLAGAGGEDDARRAAVEMLNLAREAKKTALVVIHPLRLGPRRRRSRRGHAGKAAGDRPARRHRRARRAASRRQARRARGREYDLADGSTGILALAADLPAAIFALGSLARATRRLIGVGRDERRLAENLGLAIAGEEKARAAARRPRPRHSGGGGGGRARLRQRRAGRRRIFRARLRSRGARWFFRQIRADARSGAGHQRRLSG